MLFSLSAEYTSDALNAMRENPNTNRRQAVNQLLEAAGGKVIELYHTIADGPGALVIFDVPDAAAAPVIATVAAASGSVRNLRLNRLYTQEEISTLQEKAREIRSAYKAPGQQ